MSQNQVMQRRESPSSDVQHVPRCHYCSLLVFLHVQPEGRCCCNSSLRMLALEDNGEVVSSRCKHKNRSLSEVWTGPADSECSLRGRLLVDEDYGAHEGPSAIRRRGGITGAPDEGRYLGVKGDKT